MQVQPKDTSGDIDLDALLKGDPVAFERVVQKESPRLFRMIMRIVQDEDEARSVMQETYLQAFKRLDTFRRESKFSTWLYAIGLNLARASLRKMKRFDALEEDKIDRLQPTFTGGMFSQSPEAWNPQKMAERAERKQLVHDAIAELPVRGLIVTAQAKTEGFDFMSRFFAPQLNIPEDPVTGSAHCCLGPYWAERLGKQEMTGYQASARGGVVHVRVAGDRVVLGGDAVTVLRGTLVSEDDQKEE